MTPREIQELFDKLEYKASELPEIVRTRNLERLEGFCLTRTYDEVMEVARIYEIDPDYLEELLQEI